MTSTSSSDDVRWTASFLQRFAMEWLKHEILLPNFKSTMSNYLTKISRTRARREMFSVLGLPPYHPWQKIFLSHYKKLLRGVLTRAWNLKYSRGTKEWGSEETLSVEEVLPDWMKAFDEHFHFSDKVLKDLRMNRARSNEKLERVKLLTAVLRAVWGSMRGSMQGSGEGSAWVSWDRATRAAALQCGLATNVVRSMWTNLGKVSMQRLRLLTGAGDRAGSGAGGAEMRSADWLVVDLLLLYDDTETLLKEFSLKDAEQVSTLMVLMSLVKPYGLGLWPLAGDAQLWVGLTHAYNYGGRSASAVVLQRRWWELVSITRRTLPAARSAPEAVPLTCRLLALRFPALLTARLPSWRELVESGRVYAHDYALGKAPHWREMGPPPPPLYLSDEDQTEVVEKADEGHNSGPGDSRPEDSLPGDSRPREESDLDRHEAAATPPDPTSIQVPPDDDDLILVENDAEIIDLGSESDGDTGKRKDDTINKKEISRGEIEKALEKAKQGICNLQIQKRKQEIRDSLDKDLDSTLKDIASQSKVTKPEPPTPRNPASIDTEPPRKVVRIVRKRIKKGRLKSKTTQNLDNKDTNLTQTSKRLTSVDLTEGDSSDGASAGIDSKPHLIQTEEENNASCNLESNSKAKETEMIIDQDLFDNTNELNTCSQKQNTHTESFETTGNVPDVFSSLSVLEQLDPSGIVAKIIFSDDEDDCEDSNLNLNIDKNADNLHMEQEIQTTDELPQQTNGTDADITDAYNLNLKDITHDANIGSKFENNVDINSLDNEENVMQNEEIDSNAALSKTTSPKKPKTYIGPKSFILKHRKEEISKKRIGPKSFVNSLDSKDVINTENVEKKADFDCSSANIAKDASIDYLHSRERLSFESEDTQRFKKDSARIKTLLTTSDTSAVLNVLTICKIEETSDNDDTNLVIDENVKQQETKKGGSVASSSVSATLCFQENLDEKNKTEKFQSRTDLNTIKNKSNENAESNTSKKENETNEMRNIRPLSSFEPDDIEEYDCGNKLKPAASATVNVREVDNVLTNAPKADINMETNRTFSNSINESVCISEHSNESHNDPKSATNMENSHPGEDETPVMESDSDSELGTMVIDENTDKNEVCVSGDSNELAGVPNPNTDVETDKKPSSNKQSNDSVRNNIKSVVMSLERDTSVLENIPEQATAVDVDEKYTNSEKCDTTFCVNENESGNDSKHIDLDGNTSNKDNNEEPTSVSELSNKFDHTILATDKEVDVSSTEHNEYAVLVENSNDQDLTIGSVNEAITKVTESHAADIDKVVATSNVGQLVMAVQIPLYRVDELAFWRRHAKTDRIDMSGVDLSAHALQPTARTGRRLKSGLRPSWLPSDKRSRVSFDRICTVRLTRLPLHIVKGYLKKQRSQQESQDSALRTRKRVELSDIDEVRRINRRLATAQVRPLSNAQLSDFDSGSDSDYVPGGERRTQQRRSLAFPDVDNTLTPQELKEILDKLRNPNATQDDEKAQKIRYCCPARRHISYNRAKARIATKAGKQVMTYDLHAKAGPEHLILQCECCCVGALKEELEASGNLARSLKALHKNLEQLRTRSRMTPGPEPASATAESEETLSDNDQLNNPLKRKKDDQKKRKHKKKKTQENEEEEEEEKEETKQICNDYAEWVRQRNICNKYFTINPTNSTKKYKNSLTTANPSTPKPSTVTSAELNNQSTCGINNPNSNVQRPELYEQATDPNKRPSDLYIPVIKTNVQIPIFKQKQSKNIELNTQELEKTEAPQLNMGVQRLNTEAPKLTKKMIDLNELAQSCRDDILPMINTATDNDDAQKTEANAKTTFDLTNVLKDSVETETIAKTTDDITDELKDSVGVEANAKTTVEITDELIDSVKTEANAKTTADITDELKDYVRVEANAKTTVDITDELINSVKTEANAKTTDDITDELIDSVKTEANAKATDDITDKLKDSVGVEANAKTTFDITDELKDSVADKGLVVSEHNYMKAAPVGIPPVKPPTFDNLIRQQLIDMRPTLLSNKETDAKKSVRFKRPLIVRMTSERIPVVVTSSNAIPKVRPNVQHTNKNSCQETKTQPVQNGKPILIRAQYQNRSTGFRRQLSTEANSPKSNHTSSVIKLVSKTLNRPSKQYQKETAMKQQSRPTNQNSHAKQRLLHLKDLKISLVQRSNKTTNENQASQTVINQPIQNKGKNLTSNQQTDPNTNQTINSAQQPTILNQTLLYQERNVTMAQQIGQSINQGAPRPVMGSADQPLLNINHQVAMIQQSNHAFNQMTSQSGIQSQVNLNSCANMNFTQTSQQMTSQAGIQYNNLIQCSNMALVRPPTQIMSPLMSPVNQGHNMTFIHQPEQVVQQPNSILNQIQPQPVIMPQVNLGNNMILLGQPEKIISEPNYFLNQMVPQPVIQNVNQGPNISVIQNPEQLQPIIQNLNQGPNLSVIQNLEQLQPNKIFNQTKSQPTEPNISGIQQPEQPLSMFLVNANKIIQVSGEPDAMQLWNCDINKALLNGLVETSQASPGLNFMRVLHSQSHENTLMATCITSKDNRTHSSLRIIMQTPNETQPTAHILIQPSIEKYVHKEAVNQELPKNNDKNGIQPQSASSANIVNQQPENPKKNTNQTQIVSEKRKTTNKGVLHVLNAPDKDDLVPNNVTSNSIDEKLQNTNETDPVPILIVDDCDEKPQSVDNVENKVSDDYSMPLISNVVSMSQTDYDNMSEENKASVRKPEERVPSSSAKFATSGNTRKHMKDTKYGYHFCKDLFKTEPIYVKELVKFVQDKLMSPSELQILSIDSTKSLWMIFKRYIVVTDAANDALVSETYWTIKPRLQFRQIEFEKPKLLNFEASNTPLLKVKAFAKLPGTENALATATNEESTAGASEVGFQAELSDVITADGKCFKKLSDDPLTYAQVFHAMPSIQTTHQLLSENKSLFLLDTHKHRPLMPFKRQDLKEVGLKGIALYCYQAPEAGSALVHMLNRLRAWGLSSPSDGELYVAAPPRIKRVAKSVASHREQHRERRTTPPIPGLERARESGSSDATPPKQAKPLQKVLPDSDGVITVSDDE